MNQEDSHADLLRLESMLQDMEHEREILIKRIETLRNELTSFESRKPAPQPSANFSPPEKIALFKQLFRGRTDVFPKLWINSKTGKKGYSPACANEWIHGICEKPQVKCGECPNQAFFPVEDRAIQGHLHGRHVMGVYPLLKDETCCFLAMDFDKDSWRDDVQSVAETCRLLTIPYALERSRSGNGAHLWFFFTTPVSAGTARKMGCFILTETMSRRHTLSLESYDRLFPNQDTLPRGGFGNLIALPLQYEARQQGNTVFLKEDFNPYPDQWRYLALVQTMEATQVESIAAEAMRQGKVLGIGHAELTDKDDAEPWIRARSRKPKTEPILDPLPKEIKITLSQKVFVEKLGLPSVLLSQIKRLAAFQNPEFYKKQSLRLSTALTPRIISCSEDFPQHLALPRGNLPGLENLLGEHGIGLNLEDQRTKGKPLKVKFQGELTDVQAKVSRTLLKHDIGVIVAPPGMGKTVLGTALIAKRGRNTLVLVHRRPLFGPMGRPAFHLPGDRREGNRHNWRWKEKAQW